MAKLRVGVLMGGKSSEKEVSFNSGRTVCDHLDTTRYDVIPLFQVGIKLYILPWHFLHRGKISDFEHRLESQAERIAWDDLKMRVDFIYIAMHGRFAEDGTLQGFLQVLNIPYLGSKILGSALGMDKIMQKKFLNAAGIATAPSIVIHPEQIQSQAVDPILIQMKENGLSFPVIVKPYKEGSSIGVRAVKNAAQLLKALHDACFGHSVTAQKVLIEQKIEGMEFACIILTDYKSGTPIALPPTEIVTPTDLIFDYEQKYMPGKSVEYTPARVNDILLEEIKRTCINVMQTLRMSNLARIDGFVTHDNRIVIIDPNTLSGMAPASFLFREATHANMNHTMVINHLIETELHQYGLREAISSDNEDTAMSLSPQPKIRVGVLLGGPSNEREISLESGRNIIYKLSPSKYQATPLFVTSATELFMLNHQQLVLNSTAQISQTLNEESKVLWDALPELFDFIFIALHGSPGEDGAIQGTLEMLGMPYNGSSIFTSALCMDKYETNRFLRSQGFEVPAHILIAKSQWHSDTQKICDEISNRFSFPVIVKPHNDGCSVMVQKAATAKELASALETVFLQKEYALVEECITGMELTVGVVGNDTPQALPPSQTVSSAGILSIEEKFLPGAGENQTPAPLPASALAFVQQTIEKVYETVGAQGYARIDCFYQSAQQSPTGHERVIIIEINTLPGMTPATCIFHQAAEIGIKPMDFIDMLVTFGFQAHAQRQGKFLKQGTDISFIADERIEEAKDLGC